MALKPNYRQERAQKSRNREVKKQDKRRRREEASVKRKALREIERGTDLAGSTAIDDTTEAVRE